MDEALSVGAELVPLVPSVVLAVSGHAVNDGVNFPMPAYNGRE